MRSMKIQPCHLCGIARHDVAMKDRRIAELENECHQKEVLLDLKQERIEGLEAALRDIAEINGHWPDYYQDKARAALEDKE